MVRKSVAFCDICKQEIPRLDGNVLVYDGRILHPATYGDFDLCEECNNVIVKAEDLKMITLCFDRKSWDYKNL